MARVLVADDEEKLRRLVRLYLEREGMAVAEAGSGGEALALVREGDVHLLILDIMLPDGDGWAVCRTLREEGSNLPIIMLTARSDEADRVQGFDLGADDYVVKPFSPRELAGRVKALLRRIGGMPAVDGMVHGNLRIMPAARAVTVGDREIGLTPKEFDLLCLLAGKPGRAFSREEILNMVWGYDFFGDLRTVDSHVKNLREKLGSFDAGHKYIHTVWGIGYKFEVRQ